MNITAVYHWVIYNFKIYNMKKKEYIKKFKDKINFELSKWDSTIRPDTIILSEYDYFLNDSYLGNSLGNSFSNVIFSFDIKKGEFILAITYKHKI